MLIYIYVGIQVLSFKINNIKLVQVKECDGRDFWYTYWKVEVSD